MPGLNSILNSIFGSSNERKLKKYKDQVHAINELEEKYENFSDEELKDKTFEFKELLKNKTKIEDITNDAFAIVREAAKRTLGQRHYDVQILGGLVLNKGNITEMKTGEGKTLVATLPAYLNALTGKGVHVITVNDYLAKRDADWMGQIYNFLGLSVGCVTSATSHEDRSNQYDSDIVYATNNEIGFDYLRDNLKTDYDN